VFDGMKNFKITSFENICTRDYELKDVTYIDYIIIYLDFIINSFYSISSSSLPF